MNFKNLPKYLDLEKNTDINGIFVNKDSACENNCPGCDFGVKKADINKKRSLNELKLIIDNVSEKVNFGENLIFQPGNILLEYSVEDIEDLFEYSYNRTGKKSQWEIAKLDERILDFLKSDKIRNLIKERKLFLNVGYLEKNLDLLKSIYNEVVKIGLENRKQEIEEKGLMKEFEGLNDEEFGNKLEKYIKEEKLEGLNQDSIRFGLHNLHFSGKDGDEKYNDFKKFLLHIGLKPDENGVLNIYKKIYINIANIYFFPQIIGRNKISDGVLVWADSYESGEEKCIMQNEKMELDIMGDNTVRSHTNPCNGVSFGNIIDNTSKEIQENYSKHLNRILDIITKYKYTDGFTQSELCRMCLGGEEVELERFDKLKFNVRVKIFLTKRFISKILFK